MLRGFLVSFSVAFLFPYPILKNSSKILVTFPLVFRIINQEYHLLIPKAGFLLCMMLTCFIFSCTLQDHLPKDKEHKIPENQKGMNSFLVIIPRIIKKK